MPRHLHKNTIRNNQDNMSPLDPCNLTTVDHEKCNKLKDRESFQVTIINMINNFKKDMNKPINEFDYNSEMKGRKLFKTSI